MAETSSSGIDFAKIVETVKSVALTPAKALPGLLAEKKTLNDLIMLTGVVGLATLVGALGFGFLVYNIGISFAIQYAIAVYLGAVITPILGIFVLKFLDPSLSKLGYATEEWGKIVVYTSLPYLAAGILQIVPLWGMQWLQGLVGLYSLYLLYFVLTQIKKIPQDKVIPLIVVYLIVLSVATWAVYGLLVGRLVFGALWGQYGT